ncbi:hypothetical protein D3C78_1818540 [compost metagenome]
MQQRWQLEVAGQLQLGFEQFLLTLLVQCFDEVIQAELAHRAQALIAPQPFEPVA